MVRFLSNLRYDVKLFWITKSLELIKISKGIPREIIDLLNMGATITVLANKVVVSLQDSQISIPIEMAATVGTIVKLIHAGVGFQHEDGQLIAYVPSYSLRIGLGVESMASDLTAINERFVLKEFDTLNVKNRTVIDIGANIGDSILWFLVNGAAHVVGFEPFVPTFKQAQKNIQLNHLTGKVTLVNAGVGANNAKLVFDYCPQRSMGMSTNSWVKDTLPGLPMQKERVSIISFQDAMREHVPDSLRSRGMVLKMDCEGCEFEIFTNPKIEEQIASFEEVLIEYHYQAPDLILNRLKNCGFNVETLHETKNGVGLIHGTMS